MFICKKCIEINKKLRHSPQYNGFLINVCEGEIVMCEDFYDKIKKIDDVLNSANETVSSCNTCTNSNIGCACEDSKDDNFEYHLVDVDMSSEFPIKGYTMIPLLKENSFDNMCDKITDGIIYVSVLLMQTFDKMCDKITDRFKKAWK